MHFTRKFTNRDREESIYQYFPFDVPEGVEGVIVQMRHDGRASVVDLGLFDPKGFRGWSGSERDWVAVSRIEATPGYLPGEISSGTWFVSVGLHQIEDAGVNVTQPWTYPDNTRSFHRAWTCARLHPHHTRHPHPRMANM